MSANAWRDTWRIKYGSTDYSFGRGTNGIWNSEKPAVSAWDEEVDDRRRPRSDGTYPGQDFYAGQVISFALGLVGADRDAVERMRDQFAVVWRAEEVRTKPGAMAELISPRGRSAFGRPRRWSPIDTMADSGAIEVVADFKNMMSAWYGQERSATLPFTIEAATGFSFPVTFPLVMRGTGVKATSIEIGGDLPTPVAVDFHGPLENPIADIGGRRIVLQGSIAYDEIITVDGFKRTITKKNGSSAAGMMAANSTRLTDMVFAPGAYPISLYGSSESGTAKIVVRARDAFASY